MKLIGKNVYSHFLDESKLIINSRSPFTKLKNAFINFRNSKKLSKILEDYSEFHFGDQSRLIYDDLRTGLIRREFPILMRSLTNVDINEKNIFKRDEINSKIAKLLQNFSVPTSKWHLEYLRINKVNSEAFATVSYINNKKKNYIYLIRDLKEKKSFYSWKIIVEEDNIHL